MQDFRGRVAAITGAGSGIGRALAVDLSRRGAHLALSDVDETGLAETVVLAEGAGVKVTSARVDVADRQAVHDWADEVAAEHGSVNLVFNNAGVALGATVEGMSYEDFHWLIDINFWGVVHGTKAFLPHLQASGEGHVVNISSVFGLLGIPSQSAYNAAKFGVRGFTEALRLEMLVAGHPVQVSCVHPGGIKTAIARNARTTASHDQATVAQLFDRRLAKTSAKKAAAVIVDGVLRNRPRIVVGGDARLLDAYVRLVGSRYQGTVARVARRVAPRPKA